jgi:hypothetical protein
MTQKKKILILSSNPQDTNRLRLDQEVREIDEGLRRSKKRDNFTIDQKWAIKIRDIRRALLDYEPNIVHFCGHGDKDGLIIENDIGEAEIINSDALTGLFELCSAHIECILLNACYSEVQADAIKKHINYVIGMKKGINDHAAIEFSVGFYDALGAGKNFQDAFKFACNAIHLSNIPEHLIPALKIKTEHDQIQHCTLSCDYKTNYEPMFDALLSEKSSDLYHQLCDIRSVIIPKLKKIPNSPYSLDAEGHARQVLRLVSELYYAVLKEHFNAFELFTLGLLCLVHDVGMMPTDNCTDSYDLYQNHCQYSHDIVMSLLNKKILDEKICRNIALLCLIHNKPVGRAKSHIDPYETFDMRLNLIYSMFKIADMLEIEQHPGSILRMAPDIITHSIGEFDINSKKQTITVTQAPQADLKYFKSWCRVLSERFQESKDEFNRVGLNYKVITKPEIL